MFARVRLGLTLGFLAITSLSSCTQLSVEDCNEPGGRVLGEDVPRIRSSRVRMKLSDGPAAAARFLPFAAMSALAYVEDVDCGHPKKIDEAASRTLRALIERSTPVWTGWKRVLELEKAGPCEDESGLYYNVWKRESPSTVEVVIAFRGTSGLRDWTQGNLHWVARFFIEDQYPRARSYGEGVIRHFTVGAGKLAADRTVRFYTTGHSLGGGLAQTVFYAHPREIAQVFAFDPSPVTDYREQDLEKHQQACACDGAPPPEARIYRFYESYEILTHLRFIHKLFFAPNRHIHEVRFGFPASANPISRHSMANLALEMNKEAMNASTASKWYAGVGEGCTARFEAQQERSCAAAAGSTAWSSCPQ